VNSSNRFRLLSAQDFGADAPTAFSGRWDRGIPPDGRIFAALIHYRCDRQIGAVPPWRHKFLWSAPSVRRDYRHRGYGYPWRLTHNTGQSCLKSEVVPGTEGSLRVPRAQNSADERHRSADRWRATIEIVGFLRGAGSLRSMRAAGYFCLGPTRGTHFRPGTTPVDVILVPETSLI
jgi:hypothetical protein